MRFITAALAAVLTMSGTAFAQVAAPPVGTIQQPPPGTPGTTPGTQAPGTPAPAAQVPATPPPVVPAPVVPPLPLGARVFTGKSGLIFNAVRPDRVVDFEMVIGYLQAAFEKSNDARVREQAKGWRVFKATEPGPNSSVLYVFVIDPAIPGADYGLGRILADAYPDQIEKIWSLYTGSQASGGTLLNLMPVQPPATLPTPPSSAPSAPPAAAPRPAPPAVP
jgi:hypothetical protein